MNYPAIVYSRSNIENIHADDDVYLQACRYQVTIIDADPDSEIVERMSKFKRVRYKHHFTSDNLNHDVFEIYY